MRFTDATAATGITVTYGYQAAPDGSESNRDKEIREFAGGVAAGDCDNDGWVDLFIVRGDMGPNLLYRNERDNTFVEMAHQAGVAFSKSANENYRHSGPGFADMDGDGDIDLFIGGIESDPAKVYMNSGDCTFTDVTAGSGLDAMNARYTISSAFGDYDLDGRLDLFLSHWGTTRQIGARANTEHLWRNITENGVIRFEDVSLQAGISPSVIDGSSEESADGTGARLHLQSHVCPHHR